MKIEVTQEDIDNGLVGESGLCPVALAIKRGLKPLWVTVGSDRVWVPRLGMRRLPEDVILWIEAFDRRSSVAPITFEL